MNTDGSLALISARQSLVRLYLYYSMSLWCYIDALFNVPFSSHSNPVNACLAWALQNVFLFPVLKLPFGRIRLFLQNSSFLIYGVVPQSSKVHIRVRKDVLWAPRRFHSVSRTSLERGRVFRDSGMFFVAWTQRRENGDHFPPLFCHISSLLNDLINSVLYK